MKNDQQGRKSKGQKFGARKPDFRQGRYVVVMVRKDGRLQLNPCNRIHKFDYMNIAPGNLDGAREGDIVVVEEKQDKGFVVTRKLGREDTPGILSLISLYEKDLREEFTKAALDETQSITVPDLQDRADLRNVPLVTIDGADARDFDDAVFAEKTPDGGHHLIVAIADVSWYVRPGSGLDDEAFRRGNSTYLADMVVPMLPEKLSNGLCSLKPDEDRACMAFHLWIDKDGNLTKKQLVRGLMRSKARLTYEQVQAAKDGQPNALTAPLMNDVINPLYEAYAALKGARERRGTMDLHLTEFKVGVDQAGKVNGVAPAKRFESMKVIEEFMILANVAAAKTLEEKNAPCVYRVHTAPEENERMTALRTYLQGHGLTLPQEIESANDFRAVIEEARKIGKEELVSNAILAVQEKAVYTTEHFGHFGLALESYAHFTSPIRRYADLLVHRSLIDAFNLGAGSLDDKQRAEIDEMAGHITNTEILSAKVENAAKDRHRAAFLSTQMGKQFSGTISNVVAGGLFVRLDQSGATGFIPRSFLPQDYYELNEDDQSLKGRNSGRVYRTGATMTAILKEANGLSGAVVLKPANDNSADKMTPRFRAPRIKKPADKKPRR